MRTRCALIAVALLAAAAGVAVAADPFFRPYVIRRAGGAVRIDGKLEDDAWRHATRTPVFGDIVTGAAPRFAVSARMLWDAKYLYVAFDVDDDNIWARKTMRDDPMAYGDGYQESFVKVFIDPDSDGRDYLEMHVSPLNRVCDKRQSLPWRSSTRLRMGMTGKPKAHTDWDCAGLRSAVHINGTLNDPYDVDKGWTVEIAIPFASLKALAPKAHYPPREGDVWRLHLARRYRATPNAKDVSYWTWPAMGVVNCHEPDRWGHVVFASAKRDERLLSPPRAAFKWKALWTHAPRTLAGVRKMVALTREMGFNVLIVMAATTNGRSYYNSSFLKKPPRVEIDPLAEIIKEAKKKGIRVYAWTSNLRIPTRSFFKAHPEYAQKVKPSEEALVRAPRVNPDRPNVHGGLWLCPDRGLADLEKKVIQELASKYDIAGFGLDYLGYRNYYACFCEYSNAKRAEFAKAHPKLSRREVMRRFSEEALARWVKQAREAATAVRKDIKLAIHIYPDFDPNPLYANRLAVDYAGQTVAWFYKPFWSFGKVRDRTRAFDRAEGAFHKSNRFVPFVGVYPGEKLKSPERLRKEIRIAGSARSKRIMIAFYRTFEKHPELVKVVADELR